MPLGGLLPYVGQALDPRMMQRALQTGGAAGPSALFSPRQHAAVNPPPADFSLSVDPRSAFEGKLNDPLFRAMFGRQGTLAAAATAGGLAADSQRNMLAPTQDNQALQAEAMRQQGWMQQRQQEAAQFAKDMAMREREFGLKEDDAQFNRDLLKQLGIGGEGPDAAVVSPDAPPPLPTSPMIQLAQQLKEQEEQQQVSGRIKKETLALINSLKPRDLSITPTEGRSVFPGRRYTPAEQVEKLAAKYRQAKKTERPGIIAAIQQSGDRSLHEFLLEERDRISRGIPPRHLDSAVLLHELGLQ